jgi:ubiquinone/menaquinone biosynthesis C-methylase UbiE
MEIEIISNKEITRQSYQATASQFASNVAELAPLGSIETFTKLLPPNPKIIDIGCGSGRDAKIFSSMGAQVLGIDYCSSLIDIAKKTAPLSQFQLLDFETMELPDASFDGAWAACSLGHCAKKVFPDVLKKVHALLKEGGSFYLALKKGSGESLDEDLRYEGNIKKFWSFFEEDELINILQNAQFKILELDVVQKHHPYQTTHPALRVFSQKN